MVVIQPDKVHRITVDILKPQLIIAEAAVDFVLTDPIKATRRTASSFILTSYPKRDVQYPHIVLSTVGDSGEAIDKREAMYEHQQSVRHQVLGTKTHCYNAISGLNEFYQRKRLDLSALGLAEGKIVNTSDTIWLNDQQIHTQTITIQFIIHSGYTAP